MEFTNLIWNKIPDSHPTSYGFVYSSPIFFFPKWRRPEIQMMLILDWVQAIAGTLIGANLHFTNNHKNPKPQFLSSRMMQQSLCFHAPFQALTFHRRLIILLITKTTPFLRTQRGNYRIWIPCFRFLGLLGLGVDKWEDFSWWYRLMLRILLLNWRSDSLQAVSVRNWVSFGFRSFNQNTVLIDFFFMGSCCRFGIWCVSFDIWMWAFNVFVVCHGCF